MAKNFNNLNNKTMRKIFANAKSLLMGLVMVSAVTLSATSCSDQYDDSAIREEIEKLKQELAELRSQVENEITTLKALVEGLVTVIDVEDKGNGVVIITLSDDSKLVVNTKAEANPDNVVTIIEIDGVKCWGFYNTYGDVEPVIIDGHYVPVVAVTPEVRVSDDGRAIEVSFDGGETWVVTGYTQSEADTMIVGVEVVYSDWQTDQSGNPIPLYCELTLADGSTIRVGMRGGKFILPTDTIYAPYATDRYFYVTVEDAADYMTEIPTGWGADIKYLDDSATYEMVFHAPSYEAVQSGSAVGEGTFKMMIVFNDGTSAIIRVMLTTEPVKVKFINDGVRMEAGYGCDYLLYGLVTTTAFSADKICTNANKFLSGEAVNGIYETAFFDTTITEVPFSDIFNQKFVAGREYTFWYVVPRYEETTGGQYVLVEEIMTKIYKHSEVSFEVVESSFFDLNIAFSAVGTNGYVVGYNLASKFNAEEMAKNYTNNSYYVDNNLQEDATYEGSFLEFYNSYEPNLTPGTEYVAWYLAKNEEGVYAAEDFKVWPVTTRDFEMGGEYEISVVGEPVIDYTSIEVSLSTDDHIIMYYATVPTYEASAYPTDELAIDMLRRVGSVKISSDPVTAVYRGKDPAEKVTIFAVAANAEGKYSKVYKQNFTTKEITYNGLEPVVEVSSLKADDFRVKVSCEGASKYMYVVCQTADSVWKDVYGGTIKRAGNYMLMNPNGVGVRHSDDSNYALVDGEFHIDGLMIDEEYVIVVVAVDENGVSKGVGTYFKPMTNLGEFVYASDPNWSVGKPEIILGECLELEFFNIVWYVAPQEGYTVYTVALFDDFIEEEGLTTPEKLAAYIKTNGTVCEYSADGYVHSWKEYADLDGDGRFGPDDYIYYEENVPGVFNHFFYGTKGQTKIFTTWCDADGNFHEAFMVDPSSAAVTE